MKKIHLLFTIVLIGTLFTACNYTEEMYINENASGKINFFFDGNTMMQMAGSEVAPMEGKEKIDSTLHFKTFLKEHQDSIAALPNEKQAQLMALEPYSMHLNIDNDAQQMQMKIYRDFTKVEELEDMMNVFSQASRIDDDAQKAAQRSPFESLPTTATSYSYTHNTFTRKVSITEPELQQQRLDSLRSYEMLFAGSTYTLKYHFPKKVIETSAEGATFSVDGKTLVYEVPYMDYLKNPEILDIEVKFEQ